jgi:hypothetical protein
MMWSRRSTDPLGRLLFESYGLHVLKRPREDLDVYAVIPVLDGRCDAPGQLETLLGGDHFPFPEVRRGEHLADVSGRTSDGVTTSLGLGFLEGFLALLGAAGIAATLSGAFGRARARSVRFRFGAAQRDYVRDPFALDLALRRHGFDPTTAALRKGHEYYIVTAVQRSREVSFAALDSADSEIDLSAELAVVGAANVGLAVQRGHELTVTADRPLPYGVELSRLVPNARRGRLDLAMTRRYVKVRADDTPHPVPSMVGGPDDPMTLSFADE